MAQTVKGRAEGIIKGRIARIEKEVEVPAAKPAKRVMTPEVTPAYSPDLSTPEKRAAFDAQTKAMSKKAPINVRKEYDKLRQEFYWTDGKKEWDHDPNTRR